MSSLSTWTWHFVQKVWLFGIKDFSISISSELVFLVWSRGTVQLTNQIPRAMSQGYIQHARKHMGVHAVCMNIYMDNMWLSRTLSVGVFTFTERLSVSVCCHLWDWHCGSIMACCIHLTRSRQVIQPGCVTLNEYVSQESLLPVVQTTCFHDSPIFQESNVSTMTNKFSRGGPVFSLQVSQVDCR